MMQYKICHIKTIVLYIQVYNHIWIYRFVPRSVSLYLAKGVSHYKIFRQLAGYIVTLKPLSTICNGYPL